MDIPLPEPVLFNSEGRPVACQVTPSTEFSSKVTFLASHSSFGYSSYTVRAGRVEKDPLIHLDRTFHFKNNFYECLVELDGTLTSLKLVPGGEELLSSGAVRGNQLAAQDSTGLGSTHPGTININVPAEKRIRWEPASPGTELVFEPEGSPVVLRTPVRTQFQVRGQLNERVKAELSIQFYNDLPRIDFEWTFLFDQASIGSFFNDESKLRVHWPLSFQGKIEHDISFGVVTSFEERPFLPASWVDVWDGEKGLAYFHQGTIKHWVKNRTLVNLFAWGENTDAIGNRLGYGTLAKNL